MTEANKDTSTSFAEAFAKELAEIAKNIREEMRNREEMRIGALEDLAEQAQELDMGY